MAGRPPKPISEEEICKLLLAGTSIPAIATHHHVSTDTVRRRIAKARKIHGPGWGVPLAPPSHQGPPPDVDVNDRAALEAWTMGRLVDAAATADKPADAVRALEAIRKAKRLDEVESESAAAGGFSPQDAAHLRSVQRVLGGLLRQAIAGVIEKADTDERFALVRDLYRLHAQPKAPDDTVAKLAAALSALGPDLYVDVPIMRELVS